VSVPPSKGVISNFGFFSKHLFTDFVSITIICICIKTKDVSYNYHDFASLFERLKKTCNSKLRNIKAEDVEMVKKQMNRFFWGVYKHPIHLYLAINEIQLPS
jgi:hypothetical protein